MMLSNIRVKQPARNITFAKSDTQQNESEKGQETKEDGVKVEDQSKESKDQPKQQENDQQKQENDQPKQQDNELQKAQKDDEQKVEEKVVKIIGGRAVKKEQIFDYLKERIDTLKSMEAYEGKDALENIKNIGETYWNREFKDRTKLAETMLQYGFSDLAVRMLKYFNSEGLFKNDEIWFPTYYTLNTCWNYSDASDALAKGLAKKGVVKILVANIRHQPYLDNLSSKNVLYVVKSSLSIIQNIAKYPEVKKIFEEENTVEALKTFTTVEDDFLKTVALMAITYLISEAENAALTDTGAIPFMVRTIKAALKSAKRRHRGFCPQELTVSLGTMAVNDSNKMKIVDEQALPLFLVMLKHTDEGEQTATARAIWNLSFDKDVREKIKAEPEMMEALERLAKNSDNDQVRKSCKGALWVLQQKNNDSMAKMQEGEQADQAENEKEGHIFISYNWEHQKMVLEVVKKLKNDGHKVWVDVDQMGGSTLEAMALGIENAKLVIICMSEKYKMSPNCRTEAEYTFQLKKPIMPLMMQRYYKPDGWLGMLLGAKFYINMDGKYTMDEAYPMMTRELGRISGTKTNDIIEKSTALTQSVSPAPPMEPSAPRLPPGVAMKDPDKVKKWTKNEVADWIKKNELESLSEKFSKYDGNLLVQLVKLRQEAPEFYYRSLESKMDLELTEILLLNAAFDTL